MAVVSARRESSLRFVEDHFDVVAVRADDESCVVSPAVVRTQTGSAIVFAARRKGRPMESLDLLATLGDERQVKV